MIYYEIKFIGEFNQEQLISLATKDPDVYVKRDALSKLESPEIIEILSSQDEYRYCFEILRNPHSNEQSVLNALDTVIKEQKSKVTFNLTSVIETLSERKITPAIQAKIFEVENLRNSEDQYSRMQESLRKVREQD